MADASLENQIVVFEVGGNDCDFDWKAVADTPEAEHQPKTPVAGDLRCFARVCFRWFRAAGGTPVLCTLPPIDCARYFAWITRDGLSKEHILRFLGVQERIYRRQEYYSTVALRVAAQTEYAFVCRCGKLFWSGCAARTYCARMAFIPTRWGTGSLRKPPCAEW